MEKIKKILILIFIFLFADFLFNDFTILHAEVKKTVKGNSGKKKRKRKPKSKEKKKKRAKRPAKSRLGKTPFTVSKIYEPMREAMERLEKKVERLEKREAEVKKESPEQNLKNFIELTEKISTQEQAHWRPDLTFEGEFKLQSKKVNNVNLIKAPVIHQEKEVYSGLYAVNNAFIILCYALADKAGARVASNALQNPLIIREFYKKTKELLQFDQPLAVSQVQSIVNKNEFLNELKFKELIFILNEDELSKSEIQSKIISENFLALIIRSKAGHWFAVVVNKWSRGVDAAIADSNPALSHFDDQNLIELLKQIEKRPLKEIAISVAQIPVAVREVQEKPQVSPTLSPPLPGKAPPPPQLSTVLTVPPPPPPGRGPPPPPPPVASRTVKLGDVIKLSTEGKLTDIQGNPVIIPPDLGTLVVKNEKGEFISVKTKKTIGEGELKFGKFVIIGLDEKLEKVIVGKGAVKPTKLETPKEAGQAGVIEEFQRKLAAGKQLKPALERKMAKAPLQPREETPKEKAMQEIKGFSPTKLRRTKK